MKVFQWRELREAMAFAADGGVAIHLHKIVFPRSPACFKRAVAAGEDIAHVFCKDRELLETLARRHGVRVVKIEHPGTNRQHVDLCGKPLASMVESAKTQALLEARPKNETAQKGGE